MARLLLALYLPACLFGSGGFVLCQEADAGMVLEWALESCCEEDAPQIPLPQQSALSSAEDCPCTDYSAGFLLTQRLNLERPDAALPALLPLELPWPVMDPAAVLIRCETSIDHAFSSRPDLPGAGACPRVLRT